MNVLDFKNKNTRWPFWVLLLEEMFGIREKLKNIHSHVFSSNIKFSLNLVYLRIDGKVALYERLFPVRWESQFSIFIIFIFGWHDMFNLLSAACYLQRGPNIHAMSPFYMLHTKSFKSSYIRIHPLLFENVCKYKKRWSIVKLEQNWNFIAINWNEFNFKCFI